MVVGVVAFKNGDGRGDASIIVRDIVGGGPLEGSFAFGKAKPPQSWPYAS